MCVEASRKLASVDLRTFKTTVYFVIEKPSVSHVSEQTDLFMFEIVPRETLLTIQTFHGDGFQTLTFPISTSLFPWRLQFSLSLPRPTRKWSYLIPKMTHST